jgi:hypothetical protein
MTTNSAGKMKSTSGNSILIAVFAAAFLGALASLGAQRVLNGMRRRARDAAVANRSVCD